MNKERILRNWIIVLVSCTVIGMAIDFIFPQSRHENRIPQVIGSSLDDVPFENTSRPGVFDSVRNEYLKKEGIIPDAIMNN